MSSSTSDAIPFPEWFSALAANYAQHTGNSTNRMFALTLDELQALSPITKDSVVHDNAGGPGTATAAIVEKFGSDALPSILITDNVPPMVEGARTTFAKWPQIKTQVMDSLDLGDIPDDHFTHSILNFSVFAFSEPEKALKELHRTLKPDGVAALLTWKRFGAGKTIHAAQAIVRPDLPPMPIPHPEFLEEGVLERAAADAGFDREKMQVSQKSIAVNGPALDQGLKKFFLSDFTKPAHKGWTEEDVAKWPAAIEQAVKGEIEAYGGVLFEAWVVLARK